MAGGVEKMSLDLARGLVSRGHHVTIASLDKSTKESFYEWPEQVKWLRLGIGDPEKKANIGERIRRIQKLRKVAHDFKPDVGIGFQVGSFALLRVSLLGMKIPIIAAERNAPTLFNFISGGRTKRIFANLLLLSAKRISVQFVIYKDYYPIFLRKKIRVTPNWVHIPSSNKRQLDSRVFKILFVGRLTFQKNLKVLLDAVKLIDFPFQLTIIGDGPDAILLNSGLETSTTISHSLPLKDLSSAYLNSHVLCLSSRWEGFPNVAVESLAHGTPVVGFSDCAGMKELILPGINGFLADGVNSPQSLQQALCRAFESTFNTNDVVKTVQIFTFGNFIDSWERCIKECL
jgi:glycosyltransferase involved in cell wall biosynthesis